jgi:isopenicillin-N epimerase
VRPLQPDLVSDFRRLWWLTKGTVFLNHGSFGACPKAILDLQFELRRKMEREPVQFLWRHYEQRLEPARVALAKFLHARSRDLVFTTNATTGVNAVMRSIKLRPNDEVITTDLAYNACYNTLVACTHRARARLVIARVPFPIRHPDQVLEAVLKCVSHRTRLAMLDHVSSHTALVLPIERLVRELDARGIDVLVDGAHAPGMLPIHLGRLRPAYYTGNLHKWVCAPKGAAFLWVREDRQAHLQPAVISHGNNTPRPGYTPFQDRFDWAGTFDPTAWFCVPAALNWMAQILPGGWPEVQKRNRTLAVLARRFLCKELQVEPPCPETMLGAMATVPLPDAFQGRPRSGKIDDEQLRLYDEFAIEVPFVRVGAPPKRYFRISAQLYNACEDYTRLARALHRLERHIGNKLANGARPSRAQQGGEGRIASKNTDTVIEPKLLRPGTACSY